MRAVTSASASAPTSVSMWPASATSASDPLTQPPTASMIMKPAVSEKRHGGGSTPRTTRPGVISHAVRLSFTGFRMLRRSCSASAMAMTCGASAARRAALYSMTLVRLMKSYTPRGEAYRAVPLVGSTWLGPAM